LLALTINFGVASMVEGTTIPTATVSRTGSTFSALPVTLMSTDAAAASVPSSVTIPAGQTSVQFTLTAPADGVVDATKTVTITAAASDHPNATRDLTVVNVDALRSGGKPQRRGRHLRRRRFHVAVWPVHVGRGSLEASSGAPRFV
jgi:hypothetical protein